jgi:hypothetical protein
VWRRRLRVEVLAGRSNSAIAAGNALGANVAASTHATRYEASHIRRSVPRSWISNTKPIRASLMWATPTPTEMSSPSFAGDLNRDSTDVRGR